MTEVELRDAATVMLVRDGDDGRMEVFMLRRNLNSDFVGGAYVFPGGAVDEADRHADLEAVCAGRSDDQASALLGIDRGGLAFWVAAVRECFEEAGVLLAYGRDGQVISFADDETARRFHEHRQAVDTGGRRLLEVCDVEGLRLAVDRIHYFSHWITPVGPPRRYDTRFFVAAAPPEQVPLHDDRETIAHLWVNPTDALGRHRAGELDLIFPTIKNLEAITRFDKSAELLDAAAAVEQVPTILPRITSDAHGVRILLPGDAGYEEAADAPPVAGIPLPGRPGGPTRPA
ncbi:MAG TPA: NUDIX domain-containing protein [Acidimicrobiales bacterium]|nr:NUDIX domain-containing protein [Acidimicrobiales bacterium]